MNSIEACYNALDWLAAMSSHIPNHGKTKFACIMDSRVTSLKV